MSQSNCIPRYDQDAENFTPSEAASSITHEPPYYIGDTRTQSSRKSKDEGSNFSLYTYYSQADAPKFIKEVDGRGYNTQNDTYFLPSDEEEWDRLHKQHLAFMIGLGCLYPCPELVRAQLARGDGDPKRILDLGCGTGVWITEMAKEFPHAEAIGVDLTPSPFDAGAVPLNCRFELDDINDGLVHFYDQFDVVHVRLITSGLVDFKRSMKEIERCLKPGGIVIYVDFDTTLVRQDQVTYTTPAIRHQDGTVEGSWLQRMLSASHAVAVKRGSDLDQAAKHIDIGLWDHPNMDPGSCATASLFMPIGPPERGSLTSDFEMTQSLQYAGSLTRQAFGSLHRAFHLLLKKGGIPQEQLNEWSDLADQELSSPIDPLWCRFRLAWGRRRLETLDEGTSANPSPRLPTTTSYPGFHIYTTPERAFEEIKRREATRNLSST